MRGKQAKKRPIKLDARYQSALVEKFITTLMKKGKKLLAQRLVYGAFEIVEEKTKLNPLAVFEDSIKNVGPAIEVRGRRVGGANYQIPMPVRGNRRQALAFRWIIGAAKTRKGLAMSEKLAIELMDAKNNMGAAVKKKEDVYRMAEANRAFAHFARFSK